MLKDTLRNLGLTDNEIAVYLAILPVGTAAASTIAKRTSIVRSTARYVCGQLVKKGLLHETRKKNTFMYSAESPDKITYLLDQEKRNLQEKEEQANRIVGELKSMMNRSLALPKVRFFEGKEGIIRLYEHILDLRAPIDSFEDSGDMASFIPDYVKEFVKKRIKRGIFNRTICPVGNSVNVNNPKEFRESRVIAADKFPFTCDIKICSNTVTIFSFDKNIPVGVSIEHEDITNNFRILFNYLWSTLPSSPKVT